MNSRLDELNQLYRKKLEQAADTPPAVLVLDSNWRAMIELNKQMCSIQTDMLRTLSALMTREDMDKYRQALRAEQVQTVSECRMIQQNMAELTETTMAMLTKQTAELSSLAGNLSEKYSSLLKESAENERRSRQKWLLAVLISQVCWMALSVILGLWFQ